MNEKSGGSPIPGPGAPGGGRGPETGPAFLAWPPPGLERMQGDLWGITLRGVLAGAILVLPMLFVVARRGDPMSHGPLGAGWWVILILSTFGLGIAADAFVTTVRMLRRSARALEQGYDLRTVVLVLADAEKDMGFLLQGARHFSELPEGERNGVATMRLGALVAYTFGALWLPVALGVGLLLASRGALTPNSLWLLVLVPSGASFLCGLIVRGIEDHLVRRARKRWFAQPWAADLVGEEIREWRKAMADRTGRALEEGRSVLGARALRAFALVVVALGVLTALPVLTLVPTSAVGSILAAVAMPKFSATSEKAARAEAYRFLRLDVDPSITPDDAAGVFADLMYVGDTRGPSELMRRPIRLIEEPWIPDERASGPLGVQPQSWPKEIFSKAVQNPSPEVRAFLADIADHPGQELFSRLARAGAVDLGSAIWVTPFPEGTNWLEVPLPKFSPLRNAGYARLAAAAHDLLEGRPAAAEEKVREVISVGLLLGDDGNTLIENLIGYVIAAHGVDGMMDLYRATGREAEAVHLEGRVRAAERAAAMGTVGRTQTPEEYLRGMPAIVLDEDAIPGLRWELLGSIATGTPCINLQRMVFGPGEAYETFLSEAREVLIRYPSQAALFDVVSAGYWGPEPEGDWLSQLLGVSMRPGRGSCNAVMKQFRDLNRIL